MVLSAPPPHLVDIDPRSFDVVAAACSCPGPWPLARSSWLRGGLSVVRQFVAPRRRGEAQPSFQDLSYSIAVSLSSWVVLSSCRLSSLLLLCVVRFLLVRFALLGFACCAGERKRGRESARDKSCFLKMQSLGETPRTEPYDPRSPQRPNTTGHLGAITTPPRPAARGLVGSQTR